MHIYTLKTKEGTYTLDNRDELVSFERKIRFSSRIELEKSQAIMAPILDERREAGTSNFNQLVVAYC